MLVKVTIALIQLWFLKFAGAPSGTRVAKCNHGILTTTAMASAKCNHGWNGAGTPSHLKLPELGTCSNSREQAEPRLGQYREDP